MNEPPGPGPDLSRYGVPPDGRIGRYEVVDKIGEGGFGVVLLARQTDPVDWPVAIKIFKAGADPARFLFEREALAVLNHPNIATILGAGETATGRPYLVMEWVDGPSITEYCDRRRLGLKARLRLFTTVCRAVQYAHQKGIIHRDLKPANVLVAEVDGRPEPKVIDFGIAKETVPGEDWAVTLAGQAVGTPEYMSPEQAGLDPTDVDTRSDVYSLGVLLYELLTGTTPFTSDELRSSTYLETLRVIREYDPPKPSTRIGDTLPDRPEIAARRGVRPASLGRTLRGDLDRIVMKALEKERDRRYGSAGALARDIERHFRGEPVTAGPSTGFYLTKKFILRHRHGLAGAAAAAAILAAGTSVSLDLYGQEKELWQREGENNRWLDGAREAEERALHRSEDLVAHLVEDLQEGLRRSGQPGLLRPVVEMADRYFTEVTAAAGGPQVHNRQRNRAAVHLASAEMHLHQYRLDEAARQAERAVALRRGTARVGGPAELAQALIVLGQVQAERGEHGPAGDSFEVAEKLASLPATATASAGRLLAANAQIGRGRVDLQTGGAGGAGAKAAAERARQAEAGLKTLAPGPEVAEARASAALLRAEAAAATGDFAAAAAAADDGLGALLPPEGEATAPGPERATARQLRSRLQTLGVEIGAVHGTAPGDPRLVAQGKTAVNTLAALAAGDPENLTWRHDLWRARRALGVHLVSLGRHTDAAPRLHAAAGTLEELTGERPGRHGWVLDLAATWVDIAELRRRQRLFGPAEEACQKALESREKLPADRREGRPAELGWLHQTRAEIAFRQDQFGLAKSAFLEAREAYLSGGGGGLHRAAARAAVRAGAMALELKEVGTALEHIRTGLEEFEALADGTAGSASAGDVAGARTELARALLATGGASDREEARELASAAIEVLGDEPGPLLARARVVLDRAGAAGSEPTIAPAADRDGAGARPRSAAERAVDLDRAATLVEQGKTTDARALLLPLVAELRPEVGDDYAAAPLEARDQLADALGQLGTVETGRRRLGEASSHLEEAVELRRSILNDSPSGPARDDLADAHNALASTLRATRKRRPVERAEVHLRWALGVVDPLLGEGGFEQTSAGPLETASVSHHLLARVLYDLGRLQEAEESVRRAIEMRKALHAKEPNKTRNLELLGASFDQLGSVLEKRSQPGEATTAYDEARKWRQRLVEERPANLRYRRSYLYTLDKLGRLLSKRREFERARGHLELSLDRRQETAREHPGDDGWRGDLANGYDALGEFHNYRYDALKDDDPVAAEKAITEAVRQFTEAVKLRRQLAPDERSPEPRRVLLARALSDLGVAEIKRGDTGAADFKPAIKHLGESVRLWESLVAGNPSHRKYLGRTQGFLDAAHLRSRNR